MKQEKINEVEVSFDFETGDLLLTLPGGETIMYQSQEGLRVAQRLNRFVDKAIKQCYKEKKKREKSKNIH